MRDSGLIPPAGRCRYDQDETHELEQRLNLSVKEVIISIVNNVLFFLIDTVDWNNKSGGELKHQIAEKDKDKFPVALLTTVTKLGRIGTKPANGMSI